MVPTAVAAASAAAAAAVVPVPLLPVVPSRRPITIHTASLVHVATGRPLTPFQSTRTRRGERSASLQLLTPVSARGALFSASSPHTPSNSVDNFPRSTSGDSIAGQRSAADSARHTTLLMMLDAAAGLSVTALPGGGGSSGLHTHTATEAPSRGSFTHSGFPHELRPISMEELADKDGAGTGAMVEVMETTQQEQQQQKQHASSDSPSAASAAAVIATRALSINVAVPSAAAHHKHADSLSESRTRASPSGRSCADEAALRERDRRQAQVHATAHRQQQPSKGIFRAYSGSDASPHSRRHDNALADSPVSPASPHYSASHAAASNASAARSSLEAQPSPQSLPHHSHPHPHHQQQQQHPSHASVSFDVRVSSVSVAPHSPSQRGRDHTSSGAPNFSPPHPVSPALHSLRRQGSQVSVGSAASSAEDGAGAGAYANASIHPWTLFFSCHTAEDEFRSVLMSGSTDAACEDQPQGTCKANGAGAGSTTGGANSTRHMLLNVSVMLLLFFSTFAPDAQNYHEAPAAYNKKLALAATGGVLLLLIAVLNRHKHRYHAWLGPVATGAHANLGLGLGSHAHSYLSPGSSPQSHSTNPSGVAASALEGSKVHTGVSAAATSPSHAPYSYTVSDPFFSLLSPHVLLAVLFCISGCVWAASCNAFNNELPSQYSTQSAPMLGFMLLGFLSLDAFLYAHMSVVSWLVSAVYVVCALWFQNHAEGRLYSVARCVFVVGANVVLCHHSYRTEMSVRRSFLRQQQLHSARKELQQETAELRSEVFSLVLERFDIADQTRGGIASQTGRRGVKGARSAGGAGAGASGGAGGGGAVSDDVKYLMDLASPLEKAMKLLQELECDRRLTKRQFDKVRRIIEQLGSSHENIFRPKMAQIVGSTRQHGSSSAAATSAAAIAAAATAGQARLSRQQQPGRDSAVSDASAQGLPDPRRHSGHVSERVPTSIPAAVEGGNGSGDGGDGGGGSVGGGDASEPSVSADGASADEGSSAGVSGAEAHAMPQQLDADTIKWLTRLVAGDDPVDADADADDSPGPADTQTAVVASPSSQHTRCSPDELSSPMRMLSSEEEHTVAVLTEQLTEWSFDVFEVCKLTNDRPLFFLGLVLFRKNGLINSLHIDKLTLCNFLNAIENGYDATQPYHHATHAADVTRSMHFFLHKGGLKAAADLTSLDVLSALLASLIHDYAHGGLNSNFMVKSHSDLALTYNDRNVLESMHLSLAFKEMRKPANNILACLAPAQQESVRRTVIDMVLATDLGSHFEIMGHFKNALPRLLSCAPDRESEPGKVLLLKMGLKCADIAHAAKPLDQHINWSERITEEFFRQGDRERAIGLPVSPFMDRTSPNIAKAQLGFIDFIAAPMLSLWLEFLNKSEEDVPCGNMIKINREHWVQLQGQTA